MTVRTIIPILVIFACCSAEMPAGVLPLPQPVVDNGISLVERSIRGAPVAIVIS